MALGAFGVSLRAGALSSFQLASGSIGRALNHGVMELARQFPALYRSRAGVESGGT